MSVSTRLEPASVAVSPGTSAEVTLHLRNAGEIVEAYRLELVGAPAGWGAVEPAELSLYPGTAGTATVAFSPPAGTEPEAGTYPFALRVVPVERPEQVEVPEGAVEVLPAVDLDARLLARTRHGRLGARFQIAVRNAGNAAALIAVSAAEPDGKLRLRSRPASESLAPDEQGHFRIKARPRRLILKGSAQTHRFSVTVAPPEAPSPDQVPFQARTAEAVFEQRPIVPKGAGKAVAALAAVLALCVAAWYALVKPVVTSVASSAADTQASQMAAAVVRQQQASASAAAAEAGASPQVGGVSATPLGPSPTATASAAASASPASPASHAPPPPHSATTTTADYDTSLVVLAHAGKSAGATFTAPAHSTFRITDYVLENPQGDFGTIMVTVNGTRVSVLALEDFRDDDYPWVTPLQVPPGASVTVTVDCAAPGTPPDRKQPATCDESALFNGMMTVVSG